MQIMSRAMRGRFQFASSKIASGAVLGGCFVGGGELPSHDQHHDDFLYLVGVFDVGDAVEALDLGG